MAAKSKKPEIRFADFEDEWEQRLLDKCATFSKGQGYTKGDLKEVGTPIILYGRLYKNYEITIAEVDTFADAKKDSVYSKGGEIVVPASGESAEDIARASVVKYANIILGGDLNIITPDAGINSEFLALSISNGQAQRELAQKAQGKTVVHIHNEEIKELVIDFPIDEEQIQLSRYFFNIDTMIILEATRHEKLVTIKKAMLEKLFPQGDSDTPELRFGGFTEPWEQRKLGDCFFERTESMPNGELISVTTNNGVKKFSELGRHDNSNDNKEKYKKVCIGDIAYNSMRMWQGASGYSPYEGIVSPAYTVLAPNEGVNSKCVAYLFKRPDTVQIFRRNSQGIASDNWNLKYPALSEIKIMLPIDTDEQSEIANYLQYLDDLVVLQKQKVQKLKNIKSACIEKMFV